jgi:hypothetical protein
VPPTDAYGFALGRYLDDYPCIRADTKGVNTMRNSRGLTNSKMATVGLLVAALLQPQVLLSGLQTEIPSQTPPTPLTRDIGWPRQVSKDGATLIYYQPQIEDWKDYRELTGKLAFSLTPNGASKNVLGVADFRADTLVDKNTRTVFIRDVEITGVRFPSLDEKANGEMGELFRRLVPKGGEPISVDRIMADLESGKVAAHPVEVMNDPPQIFYSTKPAILLMVEGEPVLAPIEKTDLQFVVNTNWDLFFEKSKKQYYLLAEKTWLTAQDLKGPWSQIQALPKDMAKLPAGQNFDDVRKMVPPPPSGAIPQVFFSRAPSELLLFKGSPVYSRISGTRLLYVVNTDNDVFVDDSEKQYYVLLSGRWFRANNLEGPWSYAGNDLPADFAKISPNSPKARVLASVPGTVEASDAVMLAQVPTTAVVNRAEAEAKVKVTYDGEPKFAPVEKTLLQYATNTQDKVIKVGDLYYLCFQGVWFMSTTAAGPWKTADSVPKEIYTIPPSSPVYNVTYVTQTNATPTTVESSSTAGYLGMFITGAAVGAAIVYGTGYYYPPYVYWGAGPYPIYRPWPCTYGAGVVYNPWTGGWAAGRAVYGPYGAARSSAWYNPATGRYGRSASVQGWYGGRTVASSYNPWTGGYGATSQGHNAYAQWGHSVATNGNQWVRTGHVSTARGTVAGYQSSSGQGVIAHGANGTIAKGTNGTYAGHDGNVYKKNPDGSWSQYTKNGWNPVDSTQAKQQQQSAQNRKQPSPQNLQNAKERSSSSGALAGSSQRTGQARPTVQPDTMQGLNRSAQARQRGGMQTQRFQRRGGGGRFRR